MLMGGKVDEVSTDTLHCLKKGALKKLEVSRRREASRAWMRCRGMRGVLRDEQLQGGEVGQKAGSKQIRA